VNSWSSLTAVLSGIKLTKYTATINQANSSTLNFIPTFFQVMTSAFCDHCSLDCSAFLLYLNVRVFNFFHVSPTAKMVSDLLLKLMFLRCNVSFQSWVCNTLLDCGCWHSLLLFMISELSSSVVLCCVSFYVFFVNRHTSVMWRLSHSTTTIYAKDSKGFYWTLSQYCDKVTLLVKCDLQRCF